MVLSFPKWKHPIPCTWSIPKAQKPWQCQRTQWKANGEVCHLLDFVLLGKVTVSPHCGVSLWPHGIIIPWCNMTSRHDVPGNNSELFNVITGAVPWKPEDVSIKPRWRTDNWVQSSRTDSGHIWHCNAIHMWGRITSLPWLLSNPGELSKPPLYSLLFFLPSTNPLTSQTPPCFQKASLDLSRTKISNHTHSWGFP